MGKPEKVIAKKLDVYKMLYARKPMENDAEGKSVLEKLRNDGGNQQA